MNKAKLKQLKEGDKVKFTSQFTTGKVYTVHETSTGRLVYDDKGVGRYLLAHFDFFEEHKPL